MTKLSLFHVFDEYSLYMNVLELTLDMDLIMPHPGVNVKGKLPVQIGIIYGFAVLDVIIACLKCYWSEVDDPSWWKEYYLGLANLWLMWIWMLI